jgi:hypothetical protein
MRFILFVVLLFVSLWIITVTFFPDASEFKKDVWDKKYWNK